MANIDLNYIATLVDDARIQDSNAFASLFAITYKEEYRLAYSYLWDKALVQDTLLDIYLNALHSLRRLENSKDFIKWMNEMNMEACEVLADAMDIEPPKGHPKIPDYPLEDAERLLEFIFIEEGRKPNTIPLATLVEYNEYRMRRYGMQRWLLVAVICSFLLAPLFFITPEIHLEYDKKASNLGLVTYRFSVEGIIPVDTAVATLNGKDIPVLQDGKKSYYILPTSDGTLKVEVRFKNNRVASDKAKVNGVDREVPKIESGRRVGQNMLLYVKDTGSGIFWKKVYATTAEGQRITPLSYNGVIGELVFDFSSEYLDVYIPDRSGNVLHALINHKTQD